MPKARARETRGNVQGVVWGWQKKDLKIIQSLWQTTKSTKTGNQKQLLVLVSDTSRQREDKSIEIPSPSTYFHSF